MGVHAVEKNVLAVARLMVAPLLGGKLIAVTRELRQFRRDERKKERRWKITCLARKKDRVTNEMARLASCSRKKREIERPGLFHTECEKATRKDSCKTGVRDARCNGRD